MASVSAVILDIGSLPRWGVIALVARAARHLQQVINPVQVEACQVVHNTLTLVESVARLGQPVPADLRDAATHAHRISRALANSNLVNQSWAAECAGRAALLAADKPPALHAATARFLQDVHASVGNKGQNLADDLREVAGFANGLPAESPAPESMFTFIRQQAIHEAGHALYAYLVGLPFVSIQIVYDPHVEPNDGGQPRQYQQFFAGGAAADMLFGLNRNWATEQDRVEYARKGGTKFDADAQHVLGLTHFDQKSVLAIVHLLERSDPIWTPVNDSPVTDALTALGVMDKWPWS